MQYDLNQLRDPERFQRLVNAILAARFGEDVRLTPLRGPDGGSDGETTSDNPYMEYVHAHTSPVSHNPLVNPPRPGRYLFQAKYHRMGEQRSSILRGRVVKEFKDTLRTTVLSDRSRGAVNYFFLVTNVTSSKHAHDKTDRIRKELLAHHPQLHADIWWGESITTSLDWSPDLWLAFPELFPGGVPPLLARAHSSIDEGRSRTLRVATTHQYKRDLTVKFRQIELEQQLLDLFVDLDVQIQFDETFFQSLFARRARGRYDEDPSGLHPLNISGGGTTPPTALQLLIDDGLGVQRILLEGGPGQGKSTVTQMAAQIYRQKLLGVHEPANGKVAWHHYCRLRVPMRIELGEFALWLADTPDGALEEYIASTMGRDSGGISVTVEDLHAWLEGSSAILLLDGLDEIGNDAMRDRAVDAIMATIGRFEDGLGVDLRVVLTTRPPAVVGRRNKLEGFTRAAISPMDRSRIDDYLGRWLGAQITNSEDRERISRSFDDRRYEPHVNALARNPMQLSVLLQFIYLKGDAFPDRRAELYRDYFQIVIDRDVEKSPELRESRPLVEGLHSFLGFRIHGTTELEKNRRSLTRAEIVRLAGRWLAKEGHSSDLADRYFALGEERFGLIVARSGEGHSTSYGFEVQPIQEYFAASYISNRLTGANAHDVFQLLIHRSYWREVAIFLAGLRRPNEKADLVARARAADRESGEYLRPHNGKLIVLQLMIEGVLTEPRHVLGEATSFVMEMLNAATLQLSRAPHRIVGDVAEISRRYGDAATHEHIARVVRAYSQSHDHHLLGLMHRLASEGLPSDLYIDLVRHYSGAAPEAQSVVRLGCPFYSPSTLEVLGEDDEYWEGIQKGILARRFWRGALWHGVVPDVPFARRLHLDLILQFAVGDWAHRYYNVEPLRVRGDRVPAIWRLHHNVEVIRRLLSNGDTGRNAGVRDEQGLASGRLIWDAGPDEALPREVEECLRELIELSDRVVECQLGGGDSEIKRAVLDYIEAVRGRLEGPGISSWIACRCAIGILQGSNLATLHRLNVAQGVIDDLRREVMVFYDSDDIRAFSAWHYHELWVFGVPFGIRPSQGDAPRPLVSLIADAIRGHGELEESGYCSYVDDIPIPRMLLRSLVDSVRDDTAGLLRFVGAREVTGRIVGRRLKVQDTRRILKICRNTDDGDTLRGAAAMLSNAKFARIVEPKLLVKIMGAAPASQLVNRVFGDRDARSEGRRMEADEVRLAQEASRLVLERSTEFPFRVVNCAAVFAREVDVHGSTPLFEARGDLLGLEDDRR